MSQNNNAVIKAFDDILKRNPKKANLLYYPLKLGNTGDTLPLQEQQKGTLRANIPRRNMSELQGTHDR